jgi:spore coat protein A, manganese oxidase
MLSRRNLIKLGAAAGAAAVLPVERLAGAFAASELQVPRFAVPLVVPPVLRPKFRNSSADFYDITMREATTEIVPGTTSTIWGYNGIFPGPTIKARKGRPVIVRQRNSLTEDMSVHLHGANVPSGSDGHPTRDLIAPGGSRYFFYPNRQPATTLFYHDHVHMKEAPHTYKGLHGLYIIDDPHERRLRLPRGRYDVPLVITDRLFAASGEMRWPGPGEFTGDVFLVNGRPFPYFEVEQRTYRFRLLNSSSIDGIMQFKLEDDSPFHIIGNDGGLLPAPVSVNTLSLWPGERAEIVVDFSRFPLGTKIVLKNTYRVLGLTDDVMRFDVVKAPPHGNVPLPTTLVPFERLRESDATVTRDVVMKTLLNPLRMVINGQVFDPERIDFRPKLGTTEIWNIINDDANFEVPHVFHTHLVRFQILDRNNGQPPLPEERGWKDSLSVDFGQSARIIMRFGDFPGLFPFHCHLQWHNDIGMMAQMEVTR